MKLVLLLFYFLLHSSNSRRRDRQHRLKRGGINVCSDGRTGQFKCCHGWQKRSISDNGCRQPVCQKGCGENGMCQRPGICFCHDSKEMRQGPCSSSSNSTNFSSSSGACNLDCNDGLCRIQNGSPICICPNGQAGKQCEQPVCGDGCLNGGECISPHICSCKYGFEGDRCEFDHRQEYCYTKVTRDGRCARRHRSSLRITKDLCCNTFGHAWGRDCEACPARRECDGGFMPTGDPEEPCEDVDECYEFRDSVCHGGQCKNTIGSYQCICPKGYYFDRRTLECLDIDECADENYCPMFCENVPGSFRCNCPDDYDLANEGTECVANPYGTCYTEVNDADGSCSGEIDTEIKKSDCCCSTLEGVCFNDSVCPAMDSEERFNLCANVANATQPPFFPNFPTLPPFIPGGRTSEQSPNVFPTSTQFIPVHTMEVFDGSGTPPNMNNNPTRVPNFNDNPSPDADQPTRPPWLDCPDAYCESGRCEVSQTRDEIEYICHCPAGWVYSERIQDCEQRSKCEQYDNLCRHGRCIDADNSAGYECDCNLGFEPSSSKTRCVDTDECLSDGVCPHGSCLNSPGSYECTCDYGFTQLLSGDCIDINECKTIIDVCKNGICVNKEPGYSCLCDAGYEPSADGKHCVDINECEVDETLCVNGQCVNKPGTYTCECNSGFELGTPFPRTNAFGGTELVKHCVDVDECTGGEADCGEGRCLNTEGSYECICNPFYTDETGGSKQCIQSSYTNIINGDDETVVPPIIPQPQINIGISIYGDPRPGPCSRNIDLDDFKCSANNTLQRFIPSTSCCCVENQEGPVSAWGDGCSLCPQRGTDNYNNLCENAPPINHCDALVNNPCNSCNLNPPAGTCENAENGFKCRCNVGFTETAAEDDCVDIDECQLDFCKGATAKCSNSLGSFSCSCGNGYELINNVCHDIDECDEQNGERICKGNSKCKNTPGGYSCECEDGFDDFGNSTCVDNQRHICWKNINSNTCESSTEQALTKEECCNTVGRGFGSNCNACDQIRDQLPCKIGEAYCPQARKCVDVDECKVLNECQNGCTNTPGSYYCTCPEGLTLNEDERSCSDERIGKCYAEYNGQQASAPFVGRHRKDICCCSIGKAWSDGSLSSLDPCPHPQSPEFAELCPGGWGTYKPNPTGIDIDINECLQFVALCGDHGTCTNQHGRYDCNCDSGYDIDHRGLICKDINECAINQHICGVGVGTCVNNVGGFECECNDGYMQDYRGICVDVNECRTQNVCRGGTCTNTQGGFICDCGNFYKLNETTSNCDDVDVCTLNPNWCRPNGRCVDTPQNYTCDCNKGYQPGPKGQSCVDIDECCLNPCQEDCRNTEGSYECLCPEGFDLAEDQHTCQDIDECFENPDICGEVVAGTCLNSDGSFSCTCNPGFYYSEEYSMCIDFDECEDNADICGDGQCSNVAGEYTCDCYEGFCLSPDRMFCQDEDECMLGIHSCNVNADCENNYGGYNCTCADGFEGDGWTCTDVDECENDEDLCGHEATCLNTYGNYTCECSEGWHGNGFVCTNVNECDLNPNLCQNGQCQDMEGGYTCDCDDGYTPNDKFTSCVDLDECTDPDYEVCVNGVCRNLDGAFACQCWKGYELSEDGDQCVDIDECADIFACRGGLCENSIGDFTCTCPKLYLKEPTGRNQNGYDTFECKDVREGTCYKRLDMNTETCEDNYHSLMTKTACCCSDLGAGWSFEDQCEVCPLKYLPAEDIDTSPIVDPKYRNLCTDLGVHGSEIVVPINECQILGTGICKNGRCIDMDNGYRCECPVGYEEIVDEKEKSRWCEDIDECTRLTNSDGTGLCSPGGNCENIPGGYRCNCRTDLGFVPHTYKGKHSCRDERPSLCSSEPIDHCIEGSEPTADGDLMLSKRACCCIGNLGTTHNCTYCPYNDSEEWHELCDAIRIEDVCTANNNLCKGGYCSFNKFTNDLECNCPRGFAEDPIGKTCEDIDECLYPNRCPKDSTCINVSGSYHCQCDKGFRQTATNHCEDINECTDRPGTCKHGMCVNTQGNYYCTCDQGYKYQPDTHCCLDFDECSQNHTICGDVGTCFNTQGHYICKCPHGYERIDNECIDINECALSRNLCSNGDCVNSPGSFFCRCNSGFTLSPDKRYCTDINECAEGSARETCGTEEAQCANVAGGYMCFCPDGYAANTEKTDCSDVDECLEDDSLCGPNGECINVDGGYRCSCNEGFKLSNDRKFCIHSEINKCFRQVVTFDDYGSGIDSTPCSPGQEGIPSTRPQCCCQNMDNSWGDRACQNLCPREGTEEFDQLCPSGSGTSEHPETGEPVDIDECKQNPDNDFCPFATCINRVGSFRCQCNTGYTNDHNGTCIDVDECLASDDVCSAHGRCINVDGSYECACNEGYTPGLHNPGCVDINECATQQSECAYRCENTPGSYRCGCPKGYKLDNDGKSCLNENECEALISPCDRTKECIDTIGSFMCVCKPGTEDYGDGCTDIDECQTILSPCGRYGNCTNTFGSYTCNCPQGFDIEEQGRPGCFDTRNGTCFMSYHAGWGIKGSTSGVPLRMDQCCCSGAAGWTPNNVPIGMYTSHNIPNVKQCPDKQTSEYAEMCPFGHGYDNQGRDIDECCVIPKVCNALGRRTGGTCVNQSPGFACICQAGFEVSANGTACIDIDECSDDALNDCSPNSKCLNTAGNYRCQCNKGYQNHGYHGRMCVDINECEMIIGDDSNACEKNCLNTDGSFKCSCPKGWELVGGRNCRDVNECLDDANICGSGTCINEIGTYHCQCDDGYLIEGNGRKCEARIQISQPQCSIPCGRDRQCQRVRGRFKCKCPAGQRWARRDNRCVPKRSPSTRPGYVQGTRWPAPPPRGNHCSRQCRYGCNRAGGCNFCDYNNGYYQYGRDYCIRAAQPRNQFHQRYKNADEMCYNCQSEASEPTATAAAASAYDYEEVDSEYGQYSAPEFFRGYRAAPTQQMRTDLPIHITINRSQQKIFDFVPSGEGNTRRSFKYLILEERLNGRINPRPFLYMENFEKRKKRDTASAALYTALFDEQTMKDEFVISAKILAFAIDPDEKNVKSAPAAFEFDITVTK